jgi:PIN domain nuclease of toxin-antitoxin system
VVVLDTHAVVWWTIEPKRLSKLAAATIRGDDQLGISAISFWEVALLVRKQKLALGMTLREWADRTRMIPRVCTLALTPDIALLADSLPMHDDPADRFIVATASHYRTALVSKDKLIRPLRIVRTIW